MLHTLGGIPRQAPERVARLRYAHDGRLLACQSAGKLLELLRARSDKEVRKHVQRRKKRKRDKAAEAPERDQDAEDPGETAKQQDETMASDLLASMQVDAGFLPLWHPHCEPAASNPALQGLAVRSPATCSLLDPSVGHL